MNGPVFSVAIVGGGLAGMAAALELRERGAEVTLFEARSRLGGRASSFRDPATGEMVDFCQHVSMGCCTHLDDFCRRTGIDSHFRRFQTLPFHGPNGRCDVGASRWLPAPFHLVPALLRFNFLPFHDRLSVIRAIGKLSGLQTKASEDGATMADWLAAQRQSSLAIERFWNTVLVSALGESLERVSVWAAQKIFIEAFLSARDGYEVLVPDLPLSELYGARLTAKLAGLGIEVQLGAPIREILGDTSRIEGIKLIDGRERPFDAVVIAVPWWVIANVLPASVREAIPSLAQVDRIESSPITGIHLWFDRPITELPFAVLVGRQSQWLFARGQSEEQADLPSDDQRANYYQVVISASRELSGLGQDGIINIVLDDLRSVFAPASEAKLLHSKVVTEKSAVFSMLPGIERLRPPQKTPISNLALAGDWTATGWPATMEGAVRSGYLAAEALLAKHVGQVS